MRDSTLRSFRGNETKRKSVGGYVANWSATCRLFIAVFSVFSPPYFLGGGRIRERVNRCICFSIPPVACSCVPILLSLATTALPTHVRVWCASCRAHLGRCKSPTRLPIPAAASCSLLLHTRFAAASLSHVVQRNRSNTTGEETSSDAAQPASRGQAALGRSEGDLSAVRERREGKGGGLRCACMWRHKAAPARKIKTCQLLDPEAGPFRWSRSYPPARTPLGAPLDRSSPFRFISRGQRGREHASTPHEGRQTSRVRTNHRRRRRRRRLSPPSPPPACCLHA